MRHRRKEVTVRYYLLALKTREPAGGQGMKAPFRGGAFQRQDKRKTWALLQSPKSNTALRTVNMAKQSQLDFHVSEPQEDLLTLNQ